MKKQSEQLLSLAEYVINKQRSFFLQSRQHFNLFKTLENE